MRMLDVVITAYECLQYPYLLIETSLYIVCRESPSRRNLVTNLISRHTIGRQYSAVKAAWQKTVRACVRLL